MASRHETTNLIQWGGILITVTGALVYFLPLSIGADQFPGLMAALVGVLANSASSIFGRYINSQGNINPLVVTTVSMGIGGVLMLVIGIAAQGTGILTLKQWTIIGWLAVVNTAIAFTLWNKSLQTLTAVESSITNGTMLPQIAILAWIFLGEPLGGREILGMIFVVCGTLIVQLWRYFPISKNQYF